MENPTPGINRRRFLKTAGLGSMALAASQGLGHLLATPVMADGDKRTGFQFVSMSDGGVDADGVHHRIFMTGAGKFNDRQAVGGGFFSHLNAAAASVADELLASGAWKAGRVLSFTPTDDPRNPYGFNLSAVLELSARLFPEGGPHGGIPAVLTVVCNIPTVEGPIFTGFPEGFFLDIDDGVSFAPISFPGTSFPFGLTAFPVLRGRGHGDDG